MGALKMPTAHDWGIITHRLYQNKIFWNIGVNPRSPAQRTDFWGYFGFFATKPATWHDAYRLHSSTPRTLHVPKLHDLASKGYRFCSRFGV